MKLADYSPAPWDTTFTNIDSVRIDSCVGSPTYLEEYAKKFFYLGFEYNIIPKPGIYPADTIMEYTWNNIDSVYLSTMLAFKQLEIDLGSFHFRENEPQSIDTNEYGKRRLLLRFDNYQCIDSAIMYLSQLPLVISAEYFHRGKRDTTGSPLSIEMQLGNKQLKYNTVSQVLTVNSMSLSTSNYLEIYNLNGIEVKKVKIDQVQQSIDLASLTRGFYIVRYGKAIEKIIINN